MAHFDRKDLLRRTLKLEDDIEFLQTILEESEENRLERMVCEAEIDVAFERFLRVMEGKNAQYILLPSVSPDEMDTHGSQTEEPKPVFYNSHIWVTWRAIVTPTTYYYCASHNGRIFYYDSPELLGIPVHLNCRCYVER